MINDKPLQTLQNLLNEFPNKPGQLFSGLSRKLPIGIEIEVKWRAYFPDLWVEGFPNIEPAELARISEECEIREAVLLTKLGKTVLCGLPKGADKYWEFALDPVTNPAILVNQVQVLAANGMLPAGEHALHITVGDVKPCRNTYMLATILEAFTCDADRIRESMGTYGLLSLAKGWGRKGVAGLMLKHADELQHGSQHATEFRALRTPASPYQLLQLLDWCHRCCEAFTIDGHALKYDWNALADDVGQIVEDHGLPNANWGRPCDNPDVWHKAADVYPQMSAQIRSVFLSSELCCPMVNC